jgi:hypothetical protein
MKTDGLFMKIYDWYDTKKWVQWYEKIKVYILKLIKSESISKNLYDWMILIFLTLIYQKKFKNNFK